MARKRIVMINGSMRRKSTYDLLSTLKESLPGMDVRIINLGEQKIKDCFGCERCITKGGCPLEDDAAELLDELIQADGIVLGSPVYLRHISGSLKRFIDRTCSWYHRPPITGKPLMFALSTQVTGIKQAQSYLRDLSIQWGAINCGFVTSNVFNRESPKDLKALNKFLRYLNEDEKRKRRPSFKEIIEFNTQKVLALNIVSLDKEYWEKERFIESAFFYPCRISIAKKLGGQAFFLFLNRLIGRSKKV